MAAIFKPPLLVVQARQNLSPDHAAPPTGNPATLTVEHPVLISNVCCQPAIAKETGAGLNCSLDLSSHGPSVVVACTPGLPSIMQNTRIGSPFGSPFASAFWSVDSTCEGDLIPECTVFCAFPSPASAGPPGVQLSRLELHIRFLQLSPGRFFPPTRVV